MIEKKPLILSFNTIRATDLPLVGGKGANLGEMTHADFPIPSGFCVTTIAFQQFIDATPSIDELYNLLDTVTSDDIETARIVGQKVRNILLEVPIPQSIATTVKQHWRDLGRDQAYAVRSSATAEDLPDASFAGQQDTYLNIIGEIALLDAIHRCWVSLFTDRAILYRCQNNFAHRDVQLSVVVQQMVMSEASGILFTADPLTGHRHTVSIDASFGLGEALVSGIVSPDSYRVDKRSKTIIDRQIADKQIAIYPEKDGGIRQETLNESQRHQTVLRDEQILNLAVLGSRVEAHYGSPQDIEWAIVKDKIYLLQARPITSLYPVDELKSPDDSLHIYFSMGHQQNMTNAMSTLGASTMQCIIPTGHPKNSMVENVYMKTAGGRLFINLTPLLRHRVFKRIIPRVIAQMDALAPKSLQLVMQRPEFDGPHGLSFPISAITGIFRSLYRVLKALWWQDLTGIVDDVDRHITDYLSQIEKELYEKESRQEQIRYIRDVLYSIHRLALYWFPYGIAGELSKRLIARVGQPWQDEVDFDAIDLGLSGNVVTDMNLALGDLAEIARQSPQLTALFDELNHDSRAWLLQAQALENSTPFMEAWNKFLEQYGSRGSAEIDIMTQHWYEEPLQLLQVIASYLKKEKGSQRTQHRRLIDARETAVNTLLEKSKQGIGLRHRIIKRLVHVISNAGIFREHHKFVVIRFLRIAKDIVKQTASELVADKRLQSPDDIWFLTWTELLNLYGNPDFDAIQLTQKRRKQFQQFQKLTPPLIITSDGESPVVKYTLVDAPEDALIGNPVSSGVVEGVVHIIRDPQTETLEPGEILVAPFTDPGWTPLFINAGGLIMEVGGLMTHGSVVAREYGIPAVVGVRDATKILKNNQTVRVDGNRGIIEILP